MVIRLGSGGESDQWFNVSNGNRRGLTVVSLHFARLPLRNPRFETLGTASSELQEVIDVKQVICDASVSPCNCDVRSSER